MQLLGAYFYAITCGYGKMRRGGKYVIGLQAICTCNNAPDEASVP